MGCGMKREVSDLMEYITPEDFSLGDNPLDAARIKELTMRKIEKKPKHIQRWGVRLLLAAVLTVLLTMSVFAAENIMTYDNWFRDYFSGKEVVADISKNQLTLLDSGLTPINQSVTSGGYTVTLESAITDGYVAYFTFRVDAPEGVVLDGKRYIFDDVPLDIFGEGINDGKTTIRGGGWEELEDANPSDGTICMLLEMSISDPGGTVSALTNQEEKTITLHKLLVDTGAESAPETVAEGEWRFTFTLPDTDPLTQQVEMLSSPVRCTGRRLAGRHFVDTAVKVTSFRLRALTATMFYEKPLTGTWGGVFLDTIYVVMKDGSRVQARFSSGTYDGDICICTMEFDVPISFADVDCIEFPGGDKAYMP